MESKEINERLSNIENMLIGTKEVLNLEEVAKYTGLSKSYLYKLTSSHSIPHYKPQGKICFFNKAEIDAWLQQNRISTHEEIGNRALSFTSKRGKK